MPTTEDDKLLALEVLIQIREKGIHYVLETAYGKEGSKLFRAITGFTLLPIKVVLLEHDRRLYYKRYYDDMVQKGVSESTARTYAGFYSNQHTFLKEILCIAGSAQGAVVGAYLGGGVFGIVGGIAGAVAADDYYDDHEMMVTDHLSRSYLMSSYSGKKVKNYDELIAHLADSDQSKRLEAIEQQNRNTIVQLENFKKGFLPELNDLRDYKVNAKEVMEPFRTDSNSFDIKLDPKKKDEVCEFLKLNYVDCHTFSDEQLNDISVLHNNLEQQTAELKAARSNTEAYAALDMMINVFNALEDLGHATGNNQLARMGMASSSMMSVLAGGVKVANVFMQGSFDAIAFGNAATMCMSGLIGIISTINSSDNKSDPYKQYVIETLDYLVYRVERIERFMVAGFQHTINTMREEFNEIHYRLNSQILEVRGQLHRQMLKAHSHQDNLKEYFQRLDIIIGGINNDINKISSAIFLETKRNLKTALDNTQKQIEISSIGEFNAKLTDHLAQIDSIRLRARESSYTGGDISTNDDTQILNELGKIAKSAKNSNDSVALENLDFFVRYLNKAIHHTEPLDQPSNMISFYVMKKLVVTTVALIKRSLIENPDCLQNVAIVDLYHELAQQLSKLHKTIEWLTTPDHLRALQYLLSQDYQAFKEKVDTWVADEEQNTLAKSDDLYAEEIERHHTNFEHNFKKRLFETEVMMPVAWRRPMFDPFYLNVMGMSLFDFVVRVKVPNTGYYNAHTFNPLLAFNYPHTVSCFYTSGNPMLSPRYMPTSADQFAICDIQHFGYSQIFQPHWNNLKSHHYDVTVRFIEDNQPQVAELRKQLADPRFSFANEQFLLQYYNSTHVPKLLTHIHYPNLFFINTPSNLNLEEDPYKISQTDSSKVIANLQAGLGLKALRVYLRAKSLRPDPNTVKSIIEYDIATLSNLKNTHNQTLLQMIASQSNQTRLQENQAEVWRTALNQFKLMSHLSQTGDKIASRQLPKIVLFSHENEYNEAPLLNLRWPIWLGKHCYLETAFLAEDYGLGLTHGRYHLKQNEVTVKLSFNYHVETDKMEYPLCDFKFNLSDVILGETATNFGKVFRIDSSTTMVSEYPIDMQLYLVWYGGYYPKLNTLKTLAYSLTVPPYQASGQLLQTASSYTVFASMEYPEYKNHLGLCDELEKPSYIQLLEHDQRKFHSVVASVLEFKRKKMLASLAQVLQSSHTSQGQLFLRLQARRTVILALSTLLPQQTQQCPGWDFCNLEWWMHQLKITNHTLAKTFSLDEQIRMCQLHDEDINHKLTKVVDGLLSSPDQIHNLKRSLEILNTILSKHPQTPCTTDAEKHNRLIEEVTNQRFRLDKLASQNRRLIQQNNALLHKVDDMYALLAKQFKLGGSLNAECLDGYCGFGDASETKTETKVETLPEADDETENQYEYTSDDTKTYATGRKLLSIEIDDIQPVTSSATRLSLGFFKTPYRLLSTSDDHTQQNPLRTTENYQPIDLNSQILFFHFILHYIRLIFQTNENSHIREEPTLKI